MSEEKDRTTPLLTRRRIKEHLQSYPSIRRKILHQLMLTLHKRAHVSIEELYERVQNEETDLVHREEEERRARHSQDDARRLAEEQLSRVEELVLDSASLFFSPEEIDNLVILARKREAAQSIEDICSLPGVSFDFIAMKVREFCNLAPGGTRLPRYEEVGTTVALIRHLVSDQQPFIARAKNYLTIRDMEYLVSSSIGPPTGYGKIGGKAAGMYLAYKILHRKREETGEGADVAIPESIFLRSDLFNEVLRLNGLVDFYDQKYKPIAEVRAEYPTVRLMIENLEFPPYVVERLRGVLEEWGTHPLVVRSSSLLEDSFDAAFSGKYTSLFVSNQGPVEKRLRELLGAIADVFASTVAPDPIQYRKSHHLLDYDEQMGVLIQKVVGRRFGDYFLPMWAGVAFSQNEWCWNPRIKREAGLTRLVMGLGTRAVDRLSDDYVRMVPLSAPLLRPEASPQAMAKYSQHKVDVINLRYHCLESVPFRELMPHMGEVRLDLIFSHLKHGALSEAIGHMLDEDADPVITFNKLLQQPQFTAESRWILDTLEEAYGCPVDVEFAHDGQQFYLLQCRPLHVRGAAGSVSLPTDITREQTLFTAHKDVSAGASLDVEWIVYVDPEAYLALPSLQGRLRIGRIVGQINEFLHESSFILMGPGRWGSHDQNLGVKVTYADISNAILLIEIARSQGSFLPELSFGTHFFQDLAEAGIYYVPLYPEDEEVIFNDAFFKTSANELARIIPDAEEYGDVVRLIEVARARPGQIARVMMDGQQGRAIAFLEARGSGS